VRVAPLLGLTLAIAIAAAAAAETPRNVILLIGDGMGFAQVDLARLTDPRQRLHLDDLAVAGHLKVAPALGAVPDSAAAATALAAGFRTSNGRIGELVDGTPVRTILEIAEAEARATGLVTNTTITHATPAAFAAHVKNRDMEPEIASQMLASGVDVMLGGGRAFFLPRRAPGSRRVDDRDLLQEARERGFALVGTRAELLAARGERMLGLFALAGMTTEPPEPTLAEMALTAIEVLRRHSSGFFLMVEGGQIDWRCHDNDAEGVVKQVHDFDAMVGQVLAYARRTGDTLVIVTADHETGGLTLLPPRGRSGWPVRPNWSTTGHSAVDVPLLADGPGAARFTGVLESRQIAARIAEVWKLPGFGPSE